MVGINNNRLCSNNIWSLLTINFTKIKSKGAPKKDLFSNTIRHTQQHLCLGVSIFGLVMWNGGGGKTCHTNPPNTRLSWPLADKRVEKFHHP
jgi:hypothetical protein